MLPDSPMPRQQRSEHAVPRFSEPSSQQAEGLWSISKTMQEEDSIRAPLLQIYRLSPRQYGRCLSALPVVHSPSRRR